MEHKDLASRLAEEVRKMGGRRTRSRTALAEMISSGSAHMTADELFRKARRKWPEIGFATVYRTLSLLRDSGLVREIRFGKGPAKYETIAGHHDHLICIRCGKVVEVVDSGIESRQSAIYEQHGYKAVSHVMSLYGVCKRCGKKRSAVS